MIPFASQRGGGQDLATHLLNAYDNESAEVAHVRGAIAGDLHGAFKEWEVQADTLTRCEKFLYSLSINPDPRQGPLTRDQYMDYIARTEKVMGLEGQPRAIVFHVKYGREHCHVVWSRIDVERQKAVHLAFDHDKLMRITRGFARDHGLTLPKGYEKSRKAGQESLYDREKTRQTGLTKADHAGQVTEAWRQSDNARAFVQALAERGYLLAKGRRPYVLIDLYGGEHSLPKLIDDKAVDTAAARAFLERDFPVSDLPSVEDAQALVADHRKVVERSIKEEQYADALAMLKQGQQDRRATLTRERQQLTAQQQQKRLDQQHEHRQQRAKVQRDYRHRKRETRAARYRERPTGLAAFLGRVTGVEWVRKAIHRHQDGQRLKSYRVERNDLLALQQDEQRTLVCRFKVQAAELERKERVLTRVERRELAAFLRDQRLEQRLSERGSEGFTPSLTGIAGLKAEPRSLRDADLLSEFTSARDRHAETPDVLAAFRRAAAAHRTQRGDEGAQSALDQARPAAPHDNDGPQKGRDRS